MASDFTSVRQVQALLGLSPGVTSDIGLLQSLVDSVSEEFRTELNREILAAEYVEVRNGTGTSSLVLRQTPVTEIVLLEIGPPGSRVEQVADVDYVFDQYGIALLNGRFTQGVANVRVTYVAGYSSVPSDLAMAAAKTAAYRYKQLTRLGQNSKSMGNETVTFETGAFTNDVRKTLDNYMLRAPIG